MKLIVEGLSKRFNRNWIFRDINISIASSETLAVAGPNGSGKSTLLKILAGAMPASAGQVSYYREQRPVEPAKVYRYIAIGAPYADLLEELTLQEQLQFHMHFRAYRALLKPADLIGILGPQYKAGRAIGEMSSGMKQRVRLLLALCTEAEVVFLDEPTTNLDVEGREWYRNLLATYTDDATVIIASNDEEDLRPCDRRILMTDYSSRA